MSTTHAGTTRALPDAAIRFLQGIGVAAEGDTRQASVALDATTRLHFEYTDAGFCLSLLRDCPYEREAEAEQLLRRLDLREGIAYPVALGCFRDQLLLSVAIPDKRCTPNEIEAALAVLVSLGQGNK